MVDQVVLIYIVDIFLLRQGINQATARGFQTHVAIMGNNRSHAHIPVFFRQINMLLRFCIHAGSVFTQPVCFRIGINDNRLLRYGIIRRAVFFKCTDRAIHAGEPDGLAADRNAGSLLRDVPLRFQRHIARRSGNPRPLAL